MQDLTQYGSQELSLVFNNTEYLYDHASRALCFNEVKDLADELYIYTDEQIEELERAYLDGMFE